MKKTIMFDFDGTLADSKDVAFKIYNELAEEHNYKKIKKSEIPEISRASIVEKCKMLNVPKFKLAFLFYEATKRFNEHILNINLFDGIKEVVDILNNEDFNLVVVSSNSEDAIKEILHRNDVHVFTNIFSSKNLFGKHKTINNYIKKNNLKREDIIYVGDELRDIDSCKKSGVKIISVSWGFDSPELLMNNKPDYLVNTPREIVDIAKGIV